MTEATFEERLEAFEARLNARLSEAEERSAKLERERDEYKKLALLLQEQVERLKLGLLGQKAERLPKNDAQLSLAILNLSLGGDALVSPAPLQLGDIARVETIAETLVQPRMQLRYRAAGYALRGELGILIPLLQQALASDDYSVRFALEDVLFRSYWEIPAFIDALRPFSEKTIEAPRAKHYPSSDQERLLTARLLGLSPNAAPKSNGTAVPGDEALH